MQENSARQSELLDSLEKVLETVSADPSVGPALDTTPESLETVDAVIQAVAKSPVPDAQKFKVYTALALYVSKVLQGGFPAAQPRLLFDENGGLGEFQLVVPAKGETHYLGLLSWVLKSAENPEEDSVASKYLASLYILKGDRPAPPVK